MANKFRGTTWNNARFGPKIQIRRSIDLAELGDFGDITENSSDLPTSGATHRKATGGSTSATRGYTDLQGLFDAVVDTQDMGIISDATTPHRIWSSTGAITDIVTSAPTGILPVDQGDSSSSSQPTQAVIPMSDFSTNTLEHSIVNPIPSSWAMFGRNIALNDSYAIIGGSQINNAAAGAAGDNTGKAFIYNLSDGSVKYTLDNPNVFGVETHDQFGTSVDISNSYAIVGAQYEDTETVQDGTIQPGAAYIFDLSDGSLKYTLEHPDPYQWAVFGSKTAITDSYAAVGAGANNAVAIRSGSVYVYDVTDGSLLYTFNGSHENGFFGSALEINGSYMIVGESNQDKVYVYDLTDGSLLYTFSDPVSSGNGFGFATAITDTHAIVSAPQYNNSLGAAHIYDLSDGSLLYTVENTNSVNESWAFFGRSVALNGSYAVVGANNERANGVDQEGQAYVFDLSDGSLVDTIDHPNAVGTTQGDNFGYSVAINNTHVAVGANREQGSDGSDGAGAVYIFSGQ